MDNLTAQFLQKAAKLLKNAKSSENIDCVINQLRYKYLEVSAASPSEINRSEVCVRCGNDWRDGIFSLSVKSHKNKNISKKIRKANDITTLSPCRKDFLSYYKSQKDNILVKKCLVCKSITKYSMNKPITKVKKANVKLPCVENNNSISKKRKKKSGKKQSFAGLSPAAVLQARSSSCHTKVEDLSLQSNNVSNICRTPNISKLVKNSPLVSHKSENLNSTTPSTTISQTVPHRNLSSGNRKGNKKKKKPKKDAVTPNTKKSLKNDRKSFLSDVLSLL